MNDKTHHNRRKYYFGLAALLWLPCLPVQAQGDSDADNELLGQLTRLQHQYQFEIKGLEKIDHAIIAPGSGGVEEQLHRLLAEYNHIIIRPPNGKLEKVIIVNKRQKSDADRIVLPTRLRGSHHLVTVSVTGNGSAWKTLELLVDTGSDLVVLPESMTDDLGIEKSSLKTSQVQTVNGKAQAQIGELPELKIGGEIIEKVGVAFIADDLLGDNPLLGMSALGRFKVTIDDKLQLITLFKK